MMKASALLIGAAITAGIGAGQTPSPSNPILINVDLAKPMGSYKPVSSWFGYDESNYTTMKYGRQLLGELHDLSPVPVYIRAHHLLTSGDGIPELKWSSSNVFSLDKDGNPVYDFTITDQIFDAFQKAGVRPMVELGFMPKDLAAAVPGITEYQLHYPKPTMGGASNNPPKDYKMWGELVRRFTQHLVQRYGRRQVGTWYFEVWNEPDIIYWHGSPQEYFKLYDYAVAGVRAALPNAMVGGPASTGPAGAKSSAFLESFLQHCSHDKSAANGKPIPLDFISFHPKGHTALVDGHVRMGISNELQAAETGFQIVAKYPQYRHLPIILSEADPEGCAACSMKDNPANAYRNGPLYASYTAAVMNALFELQDKAKVNLIAMLSWSFEFENKDYFEGFRSLATNGIDKPILNFFRMAGLMSGERVDDHKHRPRLRSLTSSKPAFARHPISMRLRQNPPAKQPSCSGIITTTMFPRQKRRCASPSAEFPQASTKFSSSTTGSTRRTATPTPPGKTWALRSRRRPSNTFSSRLPANCNSSLHPSGSTSTTEESPLKPACLARPSRFCASNGSRKRSITAVSSE